MLHGPDDAAPKYRGTTVTLELERQVSNRDLPLETRAIIEEFLYGAPLKHTRRKLWVLKVKRTLRGV